MKKLMLTAAIVAAPVFAEPTHLVCTWEDLASGVETWALEVTPFAVTPPAVSRIEAIENVIGKDKTLRLRARYASLNVDATPSTFPTGVYRAGDPHDVIAKDFAAAETLELRIGNPLYKSDAPDHVDSFAKGAIVRTVGGVTRSYTANCIGKLIKKP